MCRRVFQLNGMLAIGNGPKYLKKALISLAASVSILRL